MTGKLLEEYDKVLERLENIETVTKAMVFHVLSIHDKEILDRMAEMSDEELIDILQKPTKEILMIMG